jgi:PAS domain S-box-containing protein
MRWILGKYGWVVPVVIFLLVLAAVLYVDGERVRREAAARQEVANVAERRAGLLADELGNAVARHIGALTAAKLRFTPVDDAVSDGTFAAAMDTVISQLGGITAISVIEPELGLLERGTAAALGRYGLDPFTDSLVANPLRRALETGQPTATGVLDLPIGRRVIVFDPVVRGDGAEVIGVLAGELEPAQVLRVALTAAPADSLRGVFYSLHGPQGDRITSVPAPPDWPIVERPVRVADTEWLIRLAYAPLGTSQFRAERLVLWALGLTFGLLISGLLLLMRSYYSRQREEIARRKAAEDTARRSAAEARARAAEARELALQLESAQRAAQRLSTSLDPDDVVELFLGGVAEILEADVASLYTFEEEGEVLVGRKRIVFRAEGPATRRLKTEDIRQVRAPAALLPGLSEAVATGEPSVVESSEAAGRPAGMESSAAVTIPLLVAGHMVGVASWEVYGAPKTFAPSMIAFAQALAAPAAAALRAAELFSSLEAARARASREALRFGTVLDQMADGVVVVDRSGRMERSNQAAEELLGPEIARIPLDEWPEAFRVTTADGRPYQAKDFPLQRALRGEHVHRTNFIAQRPGGVERFLSVSAGPILSASGELTGAALVIRDVTDEHQYAEMLRHTNRELRQQADMLERVNQQLREATKAKDQFLAVMSHELRTPINAIMGYSDLLDLGLKGELNAEQKTMVTRVRDTSRHLLGLINEILDLAKIGAGQIDLVMGEVDAGEVVRRSAEQILPLATAKGLTVNVDVERLPGDRPLLVQADETRLTQIVINLLSNAVKFTHSGEVTARCRLEGPRVELRVRDTGSGIAPEEKERIFDEFYQVDSGLSRNIGGTGLGLAIARRFARLMGGDIRVESEPGRGSEFTVELHAVGRPAERTPADDRPVVVVLAADDDMAGRVRSVLSGHARVVPTTDPARVAALSRQEEPCLVALDAAAPDLGAWRALQALQADRTTAPLRTVFIVRDRREQDSALDLGVFTTMAKPIVVKRAVEVIRSAASGSPAPVVLVADDDPDVRRILGEALAAAGCTVETADSGPQAVRTMAAVPPDVAVLDLLSPGLLGPGMLARIRANPALDRMAVVMLGGKELSPDEMQQLDRSAGELIGAPESRRVRLEELLVRSFRHAAEESARPVAT